MTFSGSALRIMHLRKRLKNRGWQTGLTPFLVVLVIVWWLLVTIWYPIWFVSRVSVWVVRHDVRKHRRERERERKRARD
jgi:di/tricarboxylate transporter